MTAWEDFQGAEFDLALGEVYGHRSFKVQPAGYLGSVASGYRWQPGINRAKCDLVAFPRRTTTVLPPNAVVVAEPGQAPDDLQHYVFRWRTMPSTSTGGALIQKRQPVLLPVPHRAPYPFCGCGFWAYYDRGDNPYHQPHQVSGVVRAHGRVVGGERGFRAEKAEVVALCQLLPPAGLRGLFRRALTTVPLNEAVRARYPEVPVFASEEEMLQAFPPSRPEEV